MRINFTCLGIEPNGGCKTILNLAKFLEKKHKVTITSLSYAKGKDHQWFGDAPCHIEYVEPGTMDRLYRKLFLTPKGLNITYSDALIRQMPDCDVNVATYYPTAYDVFASGKGRMFYLVQHNEEIMAGEGLEKAKARRSYALPMKHICVSDWVAREIYGGGTVIGNGIDPEIYNPGSGSDSLFDFGSGSGDVIREPETVMAFLRGAGWKRDDLAIEALRHVASMNLPSMKAILVSSVPKVPGLGSLKYEIHSGVSEKAMAQLYRRASVFLSTSEKEGFGLPPLEAMACGCPVVSNRYVNAGHINGNTAMLSNTAEGLAGCINRMLDSSVSAPYIKNGLAIARELTVDRAAARFEGAIMEGSV